MDMDVTVKPKVKKLLHAVSRCPEPELVAQSIEAFKLNDAYKCPAPSVLAIHMILDLYSDSSDEKANIDRIALNLETAADDLLHMSRLLRTLA